MSGTGIVLVFLKLSVEFLTKVYVRLQLQCCQLVYSLTVKNYQHCPGNIFAIYSDTDKN